MRHNDLLLRIRGWWTGHNDHYIDDHDHDVDNHDFDPVVTDVDVSHNQHPSTHIAGHLAASPGTAIDNSVPLWVLDGRDGRHRLRLRRREAPR